MMIIFSKAKNLKNKIQSNDIELALKMLHQPQTETKPGWESASVNTRNLNNPEMLFKPLFHLTYFNVIFVFFHICLYA